MILNYAVGLDVARRTQSSNQGVWPCKVPIDRLHLHLLAKSPELMLTYGKYNTSSCFWSAPVGMRQLRAKALYRSVPGLRSECSNVGIEVTVQNLFATRLAFPQNPVLNTFTTVPPVLWFGLEQTWF